MSSTRVTVRANAPRAAVYRALLEPRAVARWMVPEGMTSLVHEFDPRPGGAVRISLTYDEPSARGKTAAHTDTWRGRFVELVPDERVVEIVEFETADPAMQGEMRISISLSDVDGGTEIVAIHDDLPPGVAPADNETGWRMSLGKLAALVEEEAILESARPDIEEANDAWLPGLRNRDAASITAAYAEDGMFVAADGAVIRGRDAITRMYEERFPRLREITSGAVLQRGVAVVDAALVYEWGEAWIEMTPEVAGGPPARSGGRYLTVWRREPDGRWRITRNLVF